MADDSLQNSYKKQLILPAKREDLNAVLDFIESMLQANGCPLEIQITIAVAVEEIFVNIASYAYAASEGEATITCMVKQDELRCIVIEFRDSGSPYNPLLREPPDITLSVQERDIGGLGIFIVKNTMDDVTYRYENQQNILTIQKNF